MVLREHVARAVQQGTQEGSYFKMNKYIVAWAKFAKCDNCDVVRLLPRKPEAIGINKRGWLLGIYEQLKVLQPPALSLFCLAPAKQFQRQDGAAVMVSPHVWVSAAKDFRHYT